MHYQETGSHGMNIQNTSLPMEGGCHQRTKGLYRVKTQNTRERGWVCTIKKKGSINITEIKGSIQGAHSKLPRILPDQIRLGRGDGCERGGYTGCTPTTLTRTELGRGDGCAPLRKQDNTQPPNAHYRTRSGRARVSVTSVRKWRQIKSKNRVATAWKTKANESQSPNTR